MEPVEILTLAANGATALGVAVAAWQLRMSKSQARTDFEDGLTSHFRDILKDIPAPILLGEDVAIDKSEPGFIHLYRYIDLCNEQIFLRMMKRVSKETWENWRDGIDGMMSLPGIQLAWRTVVDSRVGRFAELAAFGTRSRDKDPADWDEARIARRQRYSIARRKPPPGLPTPVAGYTYRWDNIRKLPATPSRTLAIDSSANSVRTRDSQT